MENMFIIVIYLVKQPIISLQKSLRMTAGPVDKNNSACYDGKKHIADIGLLSGPWSDTWGFGWGIVRNNRNRTDNRILYQSGPD